MADEVEFIDADSDISFNNKDFSFKQLVLNHLASISRITSKEFFKGYWERRPVSIGGGTSWVEKYHEDGRLAYINAIDFLYDLLLPHFDKDMTIDDIDYGNYNTDQQVPLKRKVFQRLSKLLERKGYFEQQVIRD